MKSLMVSAFALSLIFVPEYSFAQQAQKQPPQQQVGQQVPQYRIEEPVRKEPHKEIEKYITISMLLIAENDTLKDEQKSKYIAEKMRIEKELTNEERGIAMETVFFRLKELDKKKAPKELNEAAKKELENEKKSLEMEMKANLKGKSDEEKKVIENFYKNRILQLEAQYR